MCRNFFCFCQDMTEALTTQNSELRAMLIKATETRTFNPDMNVENAQREDVVSIVYSLTLFRPMDFSIELLTIKPRMVYCTY